MLPASQTEGNRFTVDVGETHLLRVASIYGANASGKSNFFRALSSMFWNICSDSDNLTGESYAFDGLLQDMPILCEMAFCIINKSNEYMEYKYGYEIFDNKVINEWLVERPLGATTNYNDVYIRTGNIITFGDGDYSAIEPLKATLEKSKSTLFLRFAGRTYVEPFSSIYSWCYSSRVPNFFSDDSKKINERIKHVAYLLKSRSGYKERFLSFIQKFDPCIQNVRAVTDKSTGKGSSIEIIHTVENSKNGSHRYVSIFLESEGTQKIASIYPLIMNTLDNGGIAMVDELDTKLHPLILRELIKIFHDNNWNKKGAQLVFSAHNIVALNGQDMRADEVYFINKSDKGYSSVERLSGVVAEDLIAEDMEFGKAYLAGRFGSIPTSFTFGDKNVER